MKRHSVRVALLTLASTALAAGCAGKRADIPGDASVAVPADWRIRVDSPATLDAQWWQEFSDPALNTLVSGAITGNVDLLTTEARVRESRALYALAVARRGLDTSLALEAARTQDVNAFGHVQEFTAGGGKALASYDLDVFGRLKSSAAAAEADYRSSKAGRDELQLVVATAAATGYVELLAADARLRILRQTLDARSRTLRFVQRRASVGYASQLEAHQAQAEYDAALQLVPDAELTIVQLENALSVLEGNLAHTILRGDDLLALRLPPVPGAVPSEVLRSRPDMLQAEQRLVAADRTLDAVRAAFMPGIRLTAAGGFVDSTLLSDPVAVFSVGGSVLAPLFDSGRLQSQQAAATARRDALAYEYRKSALTAFRQVEDALAATVFTAQRDEALAQQRDALRLALRSATERYQAGYSPFLEQLDAERALLAAELESVRVRAVRLQSTINLYRALGGGWTAE